MSSGGIARKDPKQSVPIAKERAHIPNLHVGSRTALHQVARERRLEQRFVDPVEVADFKRER